MCKDMAFHYVPRDKMRLHTVHAQTFWGHVREILTPWRRWLLHYRLADAPRDIAAGLTVAAIIIPQAMAYAFLVGLPPQTGLYALLGATALAALFGSSRVVVTGPVGIVSLLTITVLLPYAPVGSERYIALATTLALGVGLVQLALGLLRFGFLARLIPHSVLLGFSSAAAIIIASTQVPPLFGFRVQQQPHVFETFWELVKHVHEGHALTAAIGVVAFAFIFVLKKYRPGFPAALVAIALGLTASSVFDFASRNIAIVGHIPATIPTPSLATISAHDLVSLMGSAFIIGFIGFVESFAIAKTIAQRTKEKISANQELIGQGLANSGSALMGGLPVSGSFSSTGVNFSAGARTPVAALIVAGMAALTLLFLTPVLYYLPRTILAAVVIAGVLQLVDLRKFREAFAISRTDGIVAVMTFITAFAFKPDDAVMIGVVLALALFLQRIMWARVSEEGFDHEWGDVLRSSHRKETIEVARGMVIVRIDMSIFYANVDYVLTQMRAIVANRQKHDDAPLRMFVMDFSAVNYVDLTAMEALGEFFKELRKQNIAIYAIYAKTPQRNVLRKAREIVGEIHFLHNLDELHTAYTHTVGCDDNCLVEQKG